MLAWQINVLSNNSIALLIKQVIVFLLMPSLPFLNRTSCQSTQFVADQIGFAWQQRKGEKSSLLMQQLSSNAKKKTPVTVQSQPQLLSSAVLVYKHYYTMTFPKALKQILLFQFINFHCHRKYLMTNSGPESV